MRFTYKSYVKFINLLQKTGYKISSYDDEWETGKKYAILRHDVDYSLEKAYSLAQIENGIGEGWKCKSTFFLLITSGFYNVFSINSGKLIEGILATGHEIGLHFDEMRYPNLIGKTDAIREKILEEADILSHVVGKPVTKVSMHRPSKNILEANLKIPGIVNTYGEQFFRNFKYVSDSRHRWREPIEDIICNQNFDKLQIFVHPFWYTENENDMETLIKTFVNSACLERYDELNNNISELFNIMDRSEILH